jgi:hypothetical protein
VAVRGNLDYTAAAGGRHTNRPAYVHGQAAQEGNIAARGWIPVAVSHNYGKRSFSSEQERRQDRDDSDDDQELDQGEGFCAAVDWD